MAIIPKQDLLKEAIEKGRVTDEHRPYIGMSGLGGTCARKIWYDFHWAYPREYSKRSARIFERGDMEEARVVKDLKAAGIECFEVLDNQAEVVDDTGHIRGHPDGHVINVPTAEKTRHLLEIKTMNDRRFKDYVKKGLKATNPTYHGQVHLYMGELGLTRCLLVTTNKNNEERHYERIKYDRQVHDDCMSRGFDILTSETPPDKIGEVTWFECKMCDAKDICHKGAPIKTTCRSCKHVNIEMDGEWTCGKYNRELSLKYQLQACPDYKLDEVFE